jgi:DDE family transposase
VRLYEVELHEVADETGLVLHVHHFPPGTSKWNKDRAPPVLSHHPELRWVRRGLTPYGFAIGELPVRQQPEADAFIRLAPCDGPNPPAYSSFNLLLDFCVQGCCRDD